jgi:predicted HicB family RNase H-like nuclease
MAKSETLNLRVSSDFKRRLMEEAKREKRSVTNYLEVILTEYWERRDSPVQRNAEKSPRK